MQAITKYLNSSTYIRNIVFGVEDSLVSTVGLLSGIAVAGVSNRNIVLTGVVLILVGLFLLGSCSAKFLKINALRHGLKMLFFGGVAVILGVVIGSIVERYAL